MKEKKSNKPFAMYGTYIGILLGLVGSYFSFALVFYYAEQDNFNLLVMFIPAIPVLAGMILGWLIHLLIRKFLCVGILGCSEMRAFLT
ncbi:hypothetical protein A3K73_05295 [Candidatus Pacearchaeota archaeon RBG_13_36_9]|nr:MAG: hypothetical protein A3K73_05295 [Candidatus Pacearchaeota archaeon RBG_13_36_9]